MGVFMIEIYKIDQIAYLSYLPFLFDCLIIYFQDLLISIFQRCSDRHFYFSFILELPCNEYGTVFISRMRVLYCIDLEAENATLCLVQVGICYIVFSPSRNMLHCVYFKEEYATLCLFQVGICYIVFISRRNMLHCVYFKNKDTTLYLFRGPKCYIVFSLRMNMLYCVYLKDESATLRYYTYFYEKCLKS